MLKKLKDNQGFTLIEILIVVALIGILSVVIIPKISRYMRNDRTSLLLISSIIAKTFDDSFIKTRTNYLAIHLNKPDEADPDDTLGDFAKRENGISVLNIDGDGKFTESKNPMLHKREFSGNFTLEEVILPGSDKITSGTVLIPFNPGGSSENAIINIRNSQNKEYSIFISKFRKEPHLFSGFSDFKTVWDKIIEN
jgi:prepilin-type N-terminal cleavage/methylation domain-containing protein